MEEYTSLSLNCKINHEDLGLLLGSKLKFGTNEINFILDLSMYTNDELSSMSYMDVLDIGAFYRRFFYKQKRYTNLYFILPKGIKIETLDVAVMLTPHSVLIYADTLEGVEIAMRINNSNTTFVYTNNKTAYQFVDDNLFVLRNNFGNRFLVDTNNVMERVFRTIDVPFVADDIPLIYTLFQIKGFGDKKIFNFMTKYKALMQGVNFSTFGMLKRTLDRTEETEAIREKILSSYLENSKNSIYIDNDYVKLLKIQFDAIYPATEL